MSFAASPSPRRRLRRRAAALVTSIGVLAAAGIAGSGTAVAAAPAATAATGESGWLRVAHLSPDTKAVDVQLTALSGGESVFDVSDVAYGAISDYVSVPVGTYVVSMVPADAASDTPPVVQASVRIASDTTITVAAFGRNSDLQSRVFQDDLTSPEAGAARIRLIQASTVSDSVDVETASGILIASEATPGQATSYASVPAGPWDLELTAAGVDDAASVELADGSVNTLFVLDNSRGGLTVMSVLDSASVGATPVGGVQTGGGGLAPSGLVELGSGDDGSDG